jgi:hypothetical protein
MQFFTMGSEWSRQVIPPPFSAATFLKKVVLMMEGDECQTIATAPPFWSQELLEKTQLTMFGEE